MDMCRKYAEMNADGRNVTEDILGKLVIPLEGTGSTADPPETPVIGFGEPVHYTHTSRNSERTHRGKSQDQVSPLRLTTRSGKDIAACHESLTRVSTHRCGVEIS